MSRFAKIGEEAINRQSELSGEEFRLYAIIVFHTWADSGICKKTLVEICAMHRLIYNHTTERYKSLRTKGWCEKAKKGIRPLIGLNSPKIGVLIDEKLQKSEFPDLRKLQKSEFETPKIGVNRGEKLQKSEFAYKECIEPLKSADFLDTTAAENAATTTAETNGHKSKYSLEEILRYIEIRIERGERLETPHKLARWMYQTGEYDLFINTVLYPEPIETRTIEYDDEFSQDAPPALEDSEFDIERKFLETMTAGGRALSEFEGNYAEADWQRLIREMGK